MATVAIDLHADQDLSSGKIGTISDPAKHAAVVTPSDAADGFLAYVSRALQIGSDGDMTVDMQGSPELAGTTVLFSGCKAGTVLPIRVKRVKSTGTTASMKIVALW